MEITTKVGSTEAMDRNTPGHGTQLPETADSSDRRVYRRYGCRGSAEVFVVGKGLHCTAKIFDVSERECFIETQHLLERGTHLELTFDVIGTWLEDPCAAAALGYRHRVHRDQLAAERADPVSAR